MGYFVFVRRISITPNFFSFLFLCQKSYFTIFLCLPFVVSRMNVKLKLPNKSYSELLYFILYNYTSSFEFTYYAAIFFQFNYFFGGPGPSHKILGGRDPPAAYAPDPEGLSKSQKRDFRKRSADVSLQEGILYYVGSRRQRSVSRQVIADLETKRRVIR